MDDGHNDETRVTLIVSSGFVSQNLFAQKISGKCHYEFKKVSGQQCEHIEIRGMHDLMLLR